MNLALDDGYTVFFDKITGISVSLVAWDWLLHSCYLCKSRKTCKLYSINIMNVFIVVPSVYSFIMITTPSNAPECWLAEVILAHGVNGSRVIAPSACRASKKIYLFRCVKQLSWLKLNSEHLVWNYNFCLADSASRSCAYISASSLAK